MSRKHYPTVPVESWEYGQWVKEDPKDVVGDLDLLQAPGDDQDLFVVELRRFLSAKLPERYQENLIIYALSDEFNGMQIWATVDGFDFLLMGHQRHNGPFPDADGKQWPAGHPHFHELHWREGQKRVRKVSVVPECLAPEMNAQAFFEAFTATYKFVPKNPSSVVLRPSESPPANTQRKLLDF